MTTTKGRRTQKKQRAAQRQAIRAADRAERVVLIRRRTFIERIVRAPMHGVRVYRKYRSYGCRRRTALRAAVAIIALTCKPVKG